MHFRITGDIEEQSGVGSIIDRVSGPTRLHFKEQDYGSEVSGVVVVLMCRNPEINFKQRIRFDKKKKTLYADIMLNLNEMISATPDVREKAVLLRIIEELPVILAKYKFKSFDEIGFENELRTWLGNFLQ